MQEDSFPFYARRGVRPLRPLVLCVFYMMLALLLSACGSKAPKSDTTARQSALPTQAQAATPASPRMVKAPQGSGYYKDDGPHAYIPASLDLVPDAVPGIEPFHPPTLRPYSALGQRFKPMTELRPFSERGRASWYGRRFHGNPTATGEPYDMYAMTAAHPTLPLPSFARVTNIENGRSVVVRVNDRGPFLRGRVIDLSYAAAHRLDFINAGSAEVEVVAITHEDIRAMTAPQQPVQLAQAGGDAPAEALAALEAGSTAGHADPAPKDHAAAGGGVDAANVGEGGDEIAALAHETAEAAASGGAYLQLGVFSTSANAHGLASRVRNELQERTDRVHLLNDGERYRLQVGPYASVDEARNEAQRIAMRMNLQPFLIYR